jgi:ubiquinone/menaquinone biosynthesis C-methylase UbiE
MPFRSQTEGELKAFYEVLLSRDRDLWQNPRRVLRLLGLKSGMRFIDVACGPGYFAAEAAEIVGEKGYVFGVDKEPLAIKMFHDRLSKAGYSNFGAKVGTAGELRMLSERFDAALVANALHDFDDPLNALSNIRHILKESGLLGNIDWKKKPASLGPPVSVRLGEKQATALIIKAGFDVVKVYRDFPFHYMIVAKKV